MMSDSKHFELMIGVRGKKRPLLTIAGHTARLPYDGTHNLGNGKYCVLDNRLEADETEDILLALKTYANPPKRHKKAKSNDNEDVTTDES